MVNAMWAVVVKWLLPQLLELLELPECNLSLRVHNEADSQLLKFD